MNPKVSLIIPIFNVEPWLGDCIKSVLAQTYKDWEAILIDDCSTDQSGSLCKTFSDRDARIKFVSHKQNQGLGAARNTGCEFATGKYLIFLDSDDLLPVNALEGMVLLAERHQLQLVLGDFFTFQDGNLIDLSSHFEQREEFKVGFGEVTTPFTWMELKDKGELLFSSIYFTTAWGKLFLRELWVRLDCRAPDGLRMAEDFIPIKKFVFSAKRIGIVDDCVLLYRRRPNSATTKRSPKAFDILRSYSLATKMFKEVGVFDQLYRDIHVFFFNAFIYHLLYFVPYLYWWSFYRGISIQMRDWDIDKICDKIDGISLRDVKKSRIRTLIKVGKLHYEHLQRIRGGY